MLATIVLSAVGLHIAATVWLWALDIPRPNRGSRTILLLRSLTDFRPRIGFWSLRRSS